MKPTKETHPAKRPVAGRTLTGADLAQVTGGDVYMQSPRGSNNRLDNP